MLGPHPGDDRSDPGRRPGGPAQTASHGPADLREDPRRVRLHRLLLPGADRGDEAKAYSKEAFVPLSHPPGHAQFDFGEAVVEIAGVRCKAALGLITLPYSDTYFVSAYPCECTETFHAAHLAGLEFFSDVAIRTSYAQQHPRGGQGDRARPGVDQSVPGPRKPLPLRPSLLPGGAGQREGPRGEPRRLQPTEPLGPGPVLSVMGRPQRVPGGGLLCRSVPPVRAKLGSKAERLVDDRAAMLALPAEAFEPRRVA